jgi:hypothetical protein
MQLQNRGTALKGCSVVLGSWRNAMVLPSFSSIELQLLICVIGAVIFVGSFLALLVSAIFGLGLVRLLYASCGWCMRRIQSYSPNRRTINVVAPIVPHHSN